jgi:ABC-type glycerol-3-phosphate transport system substrate-binding protein
MWHNPFRRREEKECEAAGLLLARQLGKDPLSAAETARLESHLATCPACRERARQEQFIHGRFQLEMPPIHRLSPTDAAHIQTQVQRRLWRKKLMLQTRQTVRGLAALVLLILFAAGVFWWWQSYDLQSLAPISLEAETDQTETTTVITFAAPASHERLYTPLMEQFQEANPTIAIQFVPLDETNSPAATQIAAMADTAVLPNAVPLEARHHFLDLVPLLTGDGSFDATDFWPGILQGCQTDNVQTGLPTRARLSLILYNQTLFDQAGVAYPEPGWTWDDFQAVVQAVAAPAGPTPRYGYIEASPIRTLGPLLTPLLTGSDPDPNQLATHLQWYVTLAEQGMIGGAELIGDIPALIQAGQVAMWHGDLSSLQNEGRTLDFAVGAVPFPADGQNQATTPVRSSCAVISAGSSQPAAAWTWLDFLSHNPPYDFSYSVPARISTTGRDDYWSRLGAETATIVHFALENGWYGQRQPGLVEVGRALETAINDGGALPEAIATALDLAAVVEVTTPEATPAAVAPPRPTATPEPVARPPGAAGAVYYVSPYYHTSLEAIVALAEAFNRDNQDIYIEVTDDRSAFDHGFEQEFAVNNYDCFASGSAAILPFFDFDPPFSEMVYSLDPFLDIEDTDFWDDFHPVQLEAARSMDGQLYGLPVVDRPSVLYYNASYLESLGLEPPPLTWNLTDFWALAEAAADDNHYGFLALPVRSGNVLDFIMNEAGVHTFDASGERPRATFDDPDLANLLNELAALAQDNVLYPYDNGGTRLAMGNSRSFSNIIRRGQGVMWPALAGVPRGLPLGMHNLVSGLPQYEIAMAPLPVDTVWLLRDGVSLFISRQAENPHVCWEWFKFLSNQPTDAFRGIPARRSVVESTAWEAAVGQAQAEVYRAVLARMDYSPAFPPEAPTPLWQWWQDALVAILIEGADAGTVLREIQPKAQATLDCMMAAGADLTALDIGGDNYDTAVACAYEVDPDYRSQDELFQEHFGSGP